MPRNNNYTLSFADAKKVVHTFGLRSREEWQRFKETNRRPANIPKSPDKVYADKWNGWKDWVGAGRKTTIAQTPAPQLAPPQLPSLTALSKIVEEVQSEKNLPDERLIPTRHNISVVLKEYQDRLCAPMDTAKCTKDYAGERYRIQYFRQFFASKAAYISFISPVIFADSNELLLMVQTEDEARIILGEYKLIKHLRSRIALEDIAIKVKVFSSL
jgi:hypothetical protein